MLRLLTPDLGATEEVDLGEEHFRRTVDFLRDRLAVVRADGKEPEDGARLVALEAHLSEMAAEAAEYLGSEDCQRIHVTIGFVPAPVLSGIRHRLAAVKTGDHEEFHATAADGDRMIVRWGLRGWRAPDAGPMPVETESVHGRQAPVASWSAVDLIERLGLLSTLSRLIAEFNDLSAEKKSRSLPVPGSTETSSTAATAPESTATMS